MPTLWICRTVNALLLLQLSACVEAAWGQSPPRVARDAGRDTGVATTRSQWSASPSPTSDSAPGLLSPFRSQGDHVPDLSPAQERQLRAETDIARGTGISTPIPQASTITANNTADSGGSGTLSQARTNQPGALARSPGALTSSTVVTGPGASSLPLIRQNAESLADRRYRVCFQQQTGLLQADGTLRFRIPGDNSVRVPTPDVDMTFPTSVTDATRACLQRATQLLIRTTILSQDANVVHTLRWQR